MENPSSSGADRPQKPLLASPMSPSVADLSLSFKKLWLDSAVSNEENQLGLNAAPSDSPAFSYNPPSENTSSYSGCGYVYGGRSRPEGCFGGFRYQGGLICDVDSVFDSFDKDCNLFILAINEYGFQDGYKYLEQLLDFKEPKMIAKIFVGVLDFVFEVMTNQYGHNFFVKLIESCNDYQLQLVIARITREKDRLVNAAFTQHGSYSIQKLIRVLKKSPLISMVLLALSREFYSMMTDQKAKNIIVACFDYLDSTQNELFYFLAKKYCIALAMDRSGCVALNDCIARSRGRGRTELLEAITYQSVTLSKDPSGNYVVQHILELEDPYFIAKICSLLRGHYIELSLQKSGSHVVETCLKSIGMQYAVYDFLECGGNKLVKVARHQYGNYVIQTALKATKVADLGLHQDLLMALHMNLHELHCVHGRNVVNLVNKFIDSI